MDEFLSKKEMIVLSIIVVLFIIGYGIHYFLTFNYADPMDDDQLVSCFYSEKKVNFLIQQANYCEVDSDCKSISLSCPFGCNVYINKDADMREVNKEIDEYNQTCNECKYQCEINRNLPAVCVENKCIEARQ